MYARTENRYRKPGPADASCLYFTRYHSPIGPLILAGDAERLVELLLPENHGTPTVPEKTWVEAADPFRAAITQLDAYFDGELTEFDLPLAPHGTPFQLRVWRELQAIPYGGTSSYAEVAVRIGNPTAARAVGLANGRNPLAIVIPCHRVIGADGSLTGYGGGLARKRWLLELEARVSARA